MSMWVALLFNCELVTECDDAMMRGRKREISGKIRNLNTQMEISKTCNASNSNTRENSSSQETVLRRL